MLIPTKPLSNTTNEALAFEFCTSKAADPDVAPDPRICKRAVGVSEPFLYKFGPITVFPPIWFQPPTAENPHV